MEYCLFSTDEHLAMYRKIQPIDEVGKKLIMRADSLRLREAVCAHYEINPFIVPKANFSMLTKKPVKKLRIRGLGINESISIQDTLQLLLFISLLPKNHRYVLNPLFLFEKLGLKKDVLDFDAFVNMVDCNNFRIADLFRRSIVAGEVKYCDYSNIDELIKKEDYILWAKKKGLPLPLFIIEQVGCWNTPEMNVISDVSKINFNMPSPVLCALGANVIAQLEMRSGKKMISDICNGNLMRLFLEKCKDAEKDKNIRAEDTVREYIEWQFRSK